MKIIKCLAEEIESTLDAAEDDIKNAIKYQDDFPIAAKAFYNKSILLMNSIKEPHDAAVTIIENYKKEKGEPPAPMMAIYEYMHERHINKSAAIRALQEMYTK